MKSRRTQLVKSAQRSAIATIRYRKCSAHVMLKCLYGTDFAVTRCAQVDGRTVFDPGFMGFEYAQFRKSG